MANPPLPPITEPPSHAVPLAEVPRNASRPRCSLCRNGFRTTAHFCPQCGTPNPALPRNTSPAHLEVSGLAGMPGYDIPPPGTFKPSPPAPRPEKAATRRPVRLSTVCLVPTVILVFCLSLYFCVDASRRNAVDVDASGHISDPLAAKKQPAAHRRPDVMGKAIADALRSLPANPRTLPERHFPTSNPFYLATPQQPQPAPSQASGDIYDETEADVMAAPAPRAPQDRDLRN